jgi:hypothetical protein
LLFDPVHQHNYLPHKSTRWTRWLFAQKQRLKLQPHTRTNQQK